MTLGKMKSKGIFYLAQPKNQFFKLFGYIPKQLEKLVFGLRENPGDQRSQTGLYCLNTNPFAIFLEFGLILGCEGRLRLHQI